MWVPNLPIVVPDYARLDLAFTVPVQMTEAPDNHTRRLTTTGQYLDVPLSIQAAITMGATGAARTVSVKAFDEDMTLIAQTVSPDAQPATENWQYSASIQFAGAFSSTGATVCMPWPPIVMMEAWKLQVTFGLAQVDDAFNRQPTVLMLRIPTGPVAEAERQLPTVVTPRVI